MSELVIRAGREKSLLRRHPWIFSGSMASFRGAVKPGETVEVVNQAGEFMARAAYNPVSQIIGRVWTWDPDEQVDAGLLARRLERAITARQQASKLIQSNAMRLVHAESDGIPGLIVDRYDEIIVIQVLTAGVELWRGELIEIIQKLTNPKTIYERSDADVRQLEGLPSRKGLVAGSEINDPVMINENGLQYLVDIVDGHKTGFYLDQRDNRSLARSIAKDQRILDCFSYTGGFAVNCILGGAQEVTLVESSNSALDQAVRNLQLNKLEVEKAICMEQDVFKYLRALRDRGVAYDMIILDPPKFAATIAQAQRAARGYKDINLLAFKLLKPGGYLLTFSCSGGVSEELFQKIVADAALDAEAQATIIKRLHQAEDHPVALSFPEGAYLKGFLIQKIN